MNLEGGSFLGNVLKLLDGGIGARGLSNVAELDEFGFRLSLHGFGLFETKGWESKGKRFERLRLGLRKRLGRKLDRVGRRRNLHSDGRLGLHDKGVLYRLSGWSFSRFGWHFDGFDVLTNNFDLL